MYGDFHGFATLSISNAHLKLEFLAQAGPRLARLTLAGSNNNLFAEIPHRQRDTPYGPFRVLGGHRLWHAPEAFPRTYIPDNNGLTVETGQDSVRLSRLEPVTNIHKSVEAHLHPSRPALTVQHTLRNDGVWPVTLAAWALTQLPPGGLAILPQTSEALDPAGLLPNRQIVLWPYTSVQDPRLQLHDDLVLIQAQPKLPPVKIGYLNRQGWIGYLRDGIFFCKRFEPPADQPYPDFGCNVESFCNDLFIELETIGPLATLEPGQSTQHTETWEITSNLDLPHTIEGARGLIQGLHLP